jgi:hypothetical protein
MAGRAFVGARPGFLKSFGKKRLQKSQNTAEAASSYSRKCLIEIGNQVVGILDAD